MLQRHAQKKRLYLSYDKSMKSNNEVALQRGSFLQKLYPLFDDPVVYSETAYETDDEEEPVTPLSQQMMRLPVDWKCDETTAIDAVFTGTQVREGFVLPDETAKHIGTVTHRLLQHLTVAGLDAWPAVTAGLIRRLLAQCGVSVLAQAEAVSQVQLLVENTLSDEKGRWILSPHREAHAEWEITTWEGNVAKKYIVDRTFIDETNTRWIIDYKTASVVSEDEIKTYQSQLDTYEAAIQRFDARPVKKAVYFPVMRKLEIF